MNTDGIATCGAASCPATQSSVFQPPFSPPTGDAEVRHDRMLAKRLAQMHHQFRTERYPINPRFLPSTRASGVEPRQVLQIGAVVVADAPHAVAEHEVEPQRHHRAVRAEQNAQRLLFRGNLLPVLHHPHRGLPAPRAPAQPRARLAPRGEEHRLADVVPAGIDEALLAPAVAFSRPPERVFLDENRGGGPGLADRRGEGELEAVPAGIELEKAERSVAEQRRGVGEKEVQLRNGETEKRGERRVGDRGIPRIRHQARRRLGMSIPAGMYRVRQHGADSVGRERGVAAEPAKQRCRVEGNAQAVAPESEQFRVFAEKPDRFEDLGAISARSVRIPAGVGRRGGRGRECRGVRCGGRRGGGGRRRRRRRRGRRGGWNERCGRRSRRNRQGKARLAGQRRGGAIGGRRRRRGGGG